MQCTAGQTPVTQLAFLSSAVKTLVTRWLPPQVSTVCSVSLPTPPRSLTMQAAYQPEASPSAPLSEAKTISATTAPVKGPAWIIHDEYPAIDSVQLEEDIQKALQDMNSIQSMSLPIKDLLPNARGISDAEVESAGLYPVLAEINRIRWESSARLRNVYVYSNCISSVDGTHALARRLTARVAELFAKHKQALQPATLFLDQVPEGIAQAFLNFSLDTKHCAFTLSHSRKMRDHSLSLSEENMLASYEIPGIVSWGSLYTDLSSAIKVQFKPSDESAQMIGVAVAAGYLDSEDEILRRAAWTGIKEAWLPHVETCAAILNAITAWRMETYSRRRLVHYLDMPLHQNRMTKASLSALFEAVNAHGDVARKALRIQAAALGKKKLDPWDLGAPAPKLGSALGTTYTFEEGIEIIANAVGAVDPEAADFVRMMRAKQWIEATSGNSKRPGAYCTSFAKSRNPRVYMSEYNGRAPLLLTLAHELGHAYHSWVMRDMPDAQLSYPMNLAETASIFFETVVSSDLLRRSSSTEEKFALSWNHARSAITFLLNIPTRFKFECDLNDMRQKAKLSASEMDGLMVAAWKQYYQDDLARLDEVGIFFATKLHFYLSGLSFYNFPYTFGWLFSLGVFAQRERHEGSSFADMYRSLLRDTGRMTAEQVVEKHIGGRISEPEFWNLAIAVVKKQVDEFEEYASELGYISS